jgi:hypothetical protein
MGEAVVPIARVFSMILARDEHLAVMLRLRPPGSRRSMRRPLVDNGADGGA